MTRIGYHVSRYLTAISPHKQEDKTDKGKHTMKHKKQGPLKHQEHSQPLQEPHQDHAQRECPKCLGTGQDDPPPGQHHGLCPKCDGDGKLEVKWKDAAKYGWEGVGANLKVSRIIEGSCSITTLKAEIEVIVDHQNYRLQVNQRNGAYTIDLIGNPNERIATGRLETYNILNSEDLYSRVSDWSAFDDLYSRVSDWSAGYTAGYNNQRKHKKRSQG